MANVNGKKQEPTAPPSPADLQFTLSEVKEVVGKLWKKVDSVELTAKEESRKTQEKIDTWTQTNRVILESNQALIQAIVQNSQETQASIRSSERGSQLLSVLSQQLQQFEQVSKQLQQTSTQPNRLSISSASPGLQALSHQISVVQTSIDKMESTANLTALKTQLTDFGKTLKSVSQTIGKLDTATTELKTSVRSLKKTEAGLDYKDWLLGSLIGLILSVLFFGVVLKRDSNYLVDHMNQVVWKLQAIEKQMTGR